MSSGAVASYRLARAAGGATIMDNACPSHSGALCDSVEVRPSARGFEVVPGNRRRGDHFADLDAAILHAEGIAPEVLVMNRSGKVRRTVTSRGILEALVAEHYAVLAGEVRHDNDGHWWVSCHWSYGELIGWFVEHGGSRYDGFDAKGGDGPYESREAAERGMAAHLRDAIAQVRRASD